MDYKAHVKEAVSKFLTREMKDRNVTKTDLARVMRHKGTQISVGVVSKWMSGKSSPSAYMLLILADIFETSTDEILGAYDF